MNATLLPERFEVGSTVDAEVVVELSKTLNAGEYIDIFQPHSWTAEVSQSYVKAFQSTDVEGREYVAVSGSTAEAELSVNIDVCHTSGDPSIKTRHGLRFRITLDHGRIQPAEFVRLSIRNTSAPLLAVREVPRILVGDDEVHPSACTGWEPTAKPGIYFRLIAPSFARPGEPFTVRLVSLDEYWNVSRSNFDALTIAVKDGPVLARDIRFQGTTAVQISIPEEGICRLVAAGVPSALTARAPHLPPRVYSGPIRVARGATSGPFWGDIHCHTGLSSDGMGTDPYTYARNASGLDFAAITEHSDSITPSDWETLRTWAKEATVPDQFAALLAIEIYHYNVYFRDHDAPLGALNRPRLRYSEAAEMLADRQIQTGPHHTGINFNTYSGRGFLYDEMPDDILSLVEVYSSHGQSERYDPMHVLAYEYNRNREPEARFNHSARGPHYARDAWAAGKRLAAIASSDDHYSQPGKAYRGCTAVFAPRLEVSAIWDAIRAGACYATTGERLLLDFQIGEKGLGETRSVPAKTSFTGTLRVWGTSPVVLCEVYRCLLDGRGIWETVAWHHGNDLDTQLSFTDEVPQDAVYYACVMEQALVAGRPVMAWTSPIWVSVKSPD